MTQEQKPEHKKCWNRENRIAVMTENYMEAGHSHDEARKLTFEGIAVAEARGAAEQRRKDAEGAEDIQAPDEGPFLIVFQEDGINPELFAGSGAKKGAYERFEMVSAGYHCRLYAAIDSSMKHDRDNGALLRVANVTALEARVKELEGALKEAAYALEQVKDCERGGYNARNGKFVSLQMSDGERADIIHSEVTEDCERALVTVRAAIREGRS